MSEKHTQRVNVVLPSAQVRALKKMAERERRTYTSLIREAIEEYTGVPDTVVLGGYRVKQSSNGDQEDDS